MKEVTGRSDRDLLAEMARTGRASEEAFTAIYRRHHDTVYRFALHMTYNTGAAEEVTQEVFLTLIREWPKFDPERGSLEAFLLGIGRNHVLRFLDRERAYVALGAEGVPDDHPAMGNGNGDPLAALTQQERVTRVRAAVLSLPAAYREVVVLCDLQGKSYAEAAEAFACAIGTVRSRLHRARGLLLQKLHSMGPVGIDEKP
ncbi:MAG: RNA polymerase sigma factor [Terriglobia bacterium]